jgi:hypothetical protein
LVTVTSSMRERYFSIPRICAPGRPFASPLGCHNQTDPLPMIGMACFDPWRLGFESSSRWVLLGFATRYDHERIIGHRPMRRRGRCRRHDTGRQRDRNNSHTYAASPTVASVAPNSGRQEGRAPKPRGRRGTAYRANAARHRARIPGFPIQPSVASDAPDDRGPGGSALSRSPRSCFDPDYPEASRRSTSEFCAGRTNCLW